MKQIEVTTKVNDNLGDAIMILEKQGFKMIRESRVEDRYLTQNIHKLNSKNIMEILTSCVLLRYLKANNSVFKKITYKVKTIEKNEVISEEKINLNCEDLEMAKKLFESLKFKQLVEVNYNVIVMAKDGVEFAFQDVEKLGLLLEYESREDFSDISNEDIKLEKIKMLNEIKSYGLNITKQYDVKKAFELIEMDL